MTETKRGRGRPRIKAGEVTVPVTLRMTESQRSKLAGLGGAEWVRQQIETARTK